MAVRAVGVRLFHLSARDCGGGAKMDSLAVELPLMRCQRCSWVRNPAIGGIGTYWTTLMLCHDPLMSPYEYSLPEWKSVTWVLLTNMVKGPLE